MLLEDVLDKIEEFLDSRSLFCFREVDRRVEELLEKEFLDESELESSKYIGLLFTHMGNIDTVVCAKDEKGIEHYLLWNYTNHSRFHIGDIKVMFWYDTENDVWFEAQPQKILWERVGLES